MPDFESFVPVVYGHDLASRPIGFFVFENGIPKIKLRKNAGITVENIQKVNQAFSPSYIITKEEDGIVLEVSLLAMSLQDNQRGSDNEQTDKTD